MIPIFKSWIAVAALLFLIGPVSAGPVSKVPGKVVSMNLCTDQLAMLVAKSGQLYSVSHFAKQPEVSVLAKKAQRYVTNHGQAEEIFLLQPDLVIAGSYSTRATVSLLRRLGFPVEVFKPAESFEGIRRNIKRMGRILGRLEQAERLVKTFDKTIDNVSSSAQSGRLAALYYKNSYTSGAGTLASDVVEHAGLTNLGSKLGFQGTTKLPLELLIMSRPDLTIGRKSHVKKPSLASELFVHPALLAISDGIGHAVMADKYWICGSPFTAEAVKRLAKFAEPGNPQDRP